MAILKIDQQISFITYMLRTYISRATRTLALQGFVKRFLPQLAGLTAVDCTAQSGFQSAPQLIVDLLLHCVLCAWYDGDLLWWLISVHSSKAARSSSEISPTP